MDSTSLPPVSKSKKKKSSKKKKNADKNSVNTDPAATQQPSDSVVPNGPSTAPAQQTKPTYPDTDADTASNASFESSASRPRRRARGKRKNKSKLQIVSESQGLTDGDAQSQFNDEEQERRVQQELYGTESPTSGSVDDAAASFPATQPTERQNQGGSDLRSPQPTVNNATEPKSDTGIKAFNIRKANPSGGRPVGTKIESSRSKGRSSSGQQQQQQQQQQQRENQGGESAQTENRESQQTTQGSESKDVSIKVDLNLEVEILLKAKIKGEIMLTFLN